MSDSDQSQPSEWTPPTVEELHAMLPQYEISGIIGRGGMGAVYRGRQARLGRDVAIKVLPESFSQGDDELNFAARFEQEARAMASLDHPAIISVFDFGETGQGQLYFVMEFIDGMDIHQYLRHHGGRLPQEQALSITAHVLDALEYAHNHGIVHRDIKPANILLNHEGRVKIADFGLAKTLAAAGEEDSAPALTMTNVAVGTPDYVAPEALDSDRTPDHRADLYAVGVMLYQMLTGSLPRGQVKMPAELIPGLDPRLDGIVSKSLQADPGDRYSSASEIRSALDPIFTTPITKAEGGEEKEEKDLPVAKVAGGLPRPKKAEPPKAPLYVGIGLAAVLVIGGLIAFFLKEDRGGGEAGNGTPASLPVNLVETSGEGALPSPTTRTPADPGKNKETANRQDGPTGPATAAIPPDPEKPKAEPKPEPAPPAVAPAEPGKSAPSPIGSRPATPPSPEPTPPAPLEEKPKPVEEPTAKIPELAALQKRFEELGAERIGALDANYLKAIEREIGKAADAGDLASVTALRAEKKRVTEKQPLPEADPSGTPKALADLRTIYRPSLAKEESTLIGQYQTALKQLEAEKTKGRKFDEALVVSAFRKSLTTGGPGSVPAAGAETSVPAPPTPANAASSLASASKDKPFVNSLGMKFVPVPIRGGPSDRETVLFGIWETRVEDYEKFLKDDRDRPWTREKFLEDDHPVVQVSWEDAAAFCEWLTEEDRKKGRIGKDERYRLPSDHEWSCAVGLGREEDADLTPQAKDSEIADVYPWGEEWPPPSGAGNYYGEETKRNPVSDGREPIEGYDDGFDRTAPVGSFEANEYGIHDLSGNVWEWCEDWYDPEKKDRRVLRGGSWYYCEEHYLQSSKRFSYPPTLRRINYGFRCVLAAGGGGTREPASVPASATNVEISPASASKDKPFVNSLGMKFVPVPVTGSPGDGNTVLFSVWETRVKDYEEFVKDGENRPWPKPDFEQEDDHPAVQVTWEDAVAFCAWLTERERKKGTIGTEQRYRLPTDHEWSCAVGIGKEEDPELLPSAKSQKLADVFPWGREWPPPKGAGNYYGEETGKNPVAGLSPMAGYEDPFDRTAPAGSFEPNEYGLHDLGGNAEEWCDDWLSGEQEKRVLRGGSWRVGNRANLLSSIRLNASPPTRYDRFGFRCVLEAGGGG